MIAFGDPRLPQRFWDKVEPEPNTGCWLWTASLRPNGYAQWALSGRKDYAHRFAYVALVGPIPTGLDLDHLCRVRPCVNPTHLEPVTRRENLLRGETHPARNVAKTHCPRGHIYDRTVHRTDGTVGRACRECQRTQDKQYRDRYPDRIAARKLDYARRNKEHVNELNRAAYRRRKETGCQPTR